MTTPRNSQTATLLPSGQVLVAGGANYCDPYSGCASLASAEVYDPTTGTWTTTGDMTMPRTDQTATLLPSGQVLVAGGQNNCVYQRGCTTLASAELYDPSTGTWTSTGSMTTPRANYTATLLPNGQVLVAGGCSGVCVPALASAELYNSSTGTWTPTGSMATGREYHTATLLANGQVLVAGGSGTPSAELYDPSTGTWTATGSLITDRSSHTATLLSNGEVLVAGGCCDSTFTAFASAELYDPSTGTWASTSSMTTPRTSHTATLLNTGQVLVAGGGTNAGDSLSSAEVYDPRMGTWTLTGSMSTARDYHTVTLLVDGRVLVAGGCDNGDCHGSLTVSSAEVYSPGTGPLVQVSATALTFAAQVLGTSSPTQTVTLTNTGSAPLVVGSVATSGANANAFAVTTSCTRVPIAPSGTCRIAVRLAPVATGAAVAAITVNDNSPTSPHGISLTGSGRGPNGWSGTGSMATAHDLPTGTLLASGQVLVAGGTSCCAPYFLSSVELYDPGTGTWATTGSMTTIRDNGTATLLPSGKVLVTGGCDTSTCPTALAELFDPHTGTWSSTGDMIVARWFHTATLLPGGQVLVAGGQDVYSKPLASAELYNPYTGKWTATGSMTSSRSSHTATLLPGGHVLVAGGCGGAYPCTNLSNAELYNPHTGTWMETGSMTTSRGGHTATLLPTGEVLVAGGCGGTNCGSIFASAELYNPSTGRWATTGAMSTPRQQHTATLLTTGKVLMAGGRNYSSLLASAELYDPRTGTWATTGSLSTGHYDHAATLLRSGNVLVAGGCCDSAGNILASAELYTPALLTDNPTSGSYGQTLVLTGTNFYAHETVNIYPDSTGNPVPYTSTTNGSGSFVLTDTVRQGTYGVHTLIAVGQTSAATATALFTVRPTLVLTPTSGASGSTVKASGYGFGAAEKVALRWKTSTGPLLGTAMSNAYGTFANGAALTFTVPASAPGTYPVYATGQSSGAQAVATFTVS